MIRSCSIWQWTILKSASNFDSSWQFVGVRGQVGRDLRDQVELELTMINSQNLFESIKDCSAHFFPNSPGNLGKAAHCSPLSSFFENQGNIKIVCWFPSFEWKVERWLNDDRYKRKREQWATDRMNMTRRGVVSRNLDGKLNWLKLKMSEKRKALEEYFEGKRGWMKLSRARLEIQLSSLLLKLLQQDSGICVRRHKFVWSFFHIGVLGRLIGLLIWVTWLVLGLILLVWLCLWTPNVMIKMLLLKPPISFIVYLILALLVLDCFWWMGSLPLILLNPKPAPNWIKLTRESLINCVGTWTE